jgi:hypothetical protein
MRVRLAELEREIDDLRKELRSNRPAERRTKVKSA